MENKKISFLIIFALGLLILSLFIFVLVKLNSEEGVEADKDNDINSEVMVNDNVNKVPADYDVNKIESEQIVDESRQTIIDNPNYRIPSSVAEIEMMGKAEKRELELDEDIDIQVLGRREDGTASAYQFIFSESDFILNLEQ